VLVFFQKEDAYEPRAHVYALLIQAT